MFALAHASGHASGRRMTQSLARDGVKIAQSEKSYNSVIRPMLGMAVDPVGHRAPVSRVTPSSNPMIHSGSSSLQMRGLSSIQGQKNCEIDQTRSLAPKKTDQAYDAAQLKAQSDLTRAVVQFEQDDGGKAKQSVIDALSRFTEVMQDDTGRLSPEATAEVAKALRTLGAASAVAAAKRDASSVTSSDNTVAERLKSSVTTGVVAFGVVSYWRGIWFLWDSLVFPEDPLMSGIASSAVGLGVLLSARAFDVALAPPLTKMNTPQQTSEQQKKP